MVFLSQNKKIVPRLVFVILLMDSCLLKIIKKWPLMTFVANTHMTPLPDLIFGAESI